MHNALKKEIVVIPKFKEPFTLREAEGKIMELGSNMQEHAYLLGKYLSWVKETELKHGEFEEWVDKKLWFTSRTARRFMFFAEACDEKGELLDRPHYYLESGKTDKLSDLAETPELPKGKYNVIYCDIPWAYDVDLSSGSTRSPENNYSVMDLEGIKAFGTKVQKIADKNCILFMWITAPKLNWMNEALEAFGFTYRTCLIWDKIKPNMGHYSSVRHEILVIAGRGNCSPACDGKTIQSIDSVQSIEKSNRHSEKPDEFVDIIEKLYPRHKFLELFHRKNGKERKNWTYWGHESI